jgi:cell division protein FtsZ
VILGLGYDENLGDNIGITIIATGFENQDTNSTINPSETKASADDIITFTLDVSNVEAKVPIIQQEIVQPIPEEEKQIIPSNNLIESSDASEVSSLEIQFDFSFEEIVMLELDVSSNVAPVLNEDKSLTPVAISVQQEEKPILASSTASSKPLSSGFLVKPSTIYATENQQPALSSVAANQVSSESVKLDLSGEEVKKNEEEIMQLVYREVPATEVQSEYNFAENTSASLQDQIIRNEDELQKAKAAERLYKLRNLSYNFNAADPNNEYESIPAYVRHNFQVNSNSMATVEKFYSNYAIETDDNNNTHISTINTFLEGKKPD